MVGFDSFDLVKSFGIDYMHGALLGVTKNLFEFWFNSTNKNNAFYVKPRQRFILNKRIAEIKPCRFISRRIHSFDDYKKFKASQFRSFILYFYPVLDGIRLFASSIYILLQERISSEEILTAALNLKKFVRLFETIYGKTRMTMNVHCLLHLVQAVKDLGPLWAQSMFCFESFNSTLKKYGEKFNNVVNQVIEQLIIETIAVKKTENSGSLECL